MAKTTGDAKSGESVQGYFRAIYRESPKLLKERSNDILYERWLKDHPGEKEVPERIRQSLSNLKSVLRSKLGGRKKAQSSSAASPVENGAAPKAMGASAKSLAQLEIAIDDAYALARHLDPQSLADVSRLLRSARNRVIIQMEQV